MIAVIRASGSISRARGPLSVPGSGITSDELIEKIRTVRGWLHFLVSHSWLVYELAISS